MNALACLERFFIYYINNMIIQGVKDRAAWLGRGGVIVYPTETAYAIGGDLENVRTLAHIMKLKKRSPGKKLSVIASDMVMARRYVHIDNKALIFAKKYWPGPLTLVLPAKKKLSPILLNRNCELAIRISGHPIARSLSKGLGRPIIATSANLSTRPPCYSLSCVLKQFGKEALRDVALVDGGRLTKRPASTVIRVRRVRIEIIRQGEMKIKTKD